MMRDHAPPLSDTTISPVLDPISFVIILVSIVNVPSLPLEITVKEEPGFFFSFMGIQTSYSLSRTRLITTLLPYL